MYSNYYATKDVINASITRCDIYTDILNIFKPQNTANSCQIDGSNTEDEVQLPVVSDCSTFVDRKTLMKN